ncbi:MAG TPA: AAA family ATPase [Vicinamibacterales bacterium]|nr:AAA family ATPase [Vicinamibacterales bacterium]
MVPVDGGDGHMDIDWQPVDHYPAATREMIARRTTAPASYESYYGLAEPPFSLSPTVRFAFRSGSYATAFDQVCRALERREGFIVITGEVGTGKSMLCRAAMQASGPNTFVSLILDPCVTAEELLAQVLSDFGVLDRDTRSPRRVAPAPLHQLIVVLQRFLTSLAPLGGRAVVIIDEAQHLHPVLLEQLRLWSNLDGDGPPLLQVVLSGQPELDALLGRAEMRQVRQRVSRRCELTCLTRSEVAEYINHRLDVARASDGNQTPGPSGLLTQGDFWQVRFAPPAVRTVAALSQGVPRLVNLLSDRALEVGCERQARVIDTRIVREAARRLNLQPAGIPRWQMQWAAAAAVVVLLAGGVSWKAIAQRSQEKTVAQVSAATAAPTPDAQPAPEIKALDVRNSVTVTIATLRSEQRAAAVAAQLVEAGFPAFTRRHPDGVSQQVIVGPYASAEEAAAAQRALEAQGVTGATVRLESSMAGGL